VPLQPYRDATALPFVLRLGDAADATPGQHSTPAASPVEAGVYASGSSQHFFRVHGWMETMDGWSGPVAVTDGRWGTMLQIRCRSDGGIMGGWVGPRRCVFTRFPHDQANTTTTKLLSPFQVSTARPVLSSWPI